MEADLAKSIKADLAAGATPLRDWPDVNVFLDMEFVHPVHMIEGYKYFRELQAHYPDALFILNTRNGEAWIRSRNAHGKGSYTNAYRRFYGYDGIEQVFDRWRRDWHEHHAAVLSHFSGALSERLFVWDIDRFRRLAETRSIYAEDRVRKTFCRAAPSEKEIPFAGTGHRPAAHRAIYHPLGPTRRME